MPAELDAVDRLLDDDRFFAPYRRHFDPGCGRPSIPIETYLRMMWLKFRYRLGFETLCRKVADSLSWRRFCRIGLGEPVPHPTTLMKISTRCGPATVEALNETLLAKAAEAKVVKLDNVRADTTAVEANVAYPTDSGLLARGVARMAALARRLKGFGLAKRTTFRDRGRSMRRGAHDIGAWLRRRTESAKDEVYAITAEMANLARRPWWRRGRWRATLAWPCAAWVLRPRGRPGRRWQSWNGSPNWWSGWRSRPGLGRRVVVAAIPVAARGSVGRPGRPSRCPGAASRSAGAVSRRPGPRRDGAGEGLDQPGRGEALAGGDGFAHIGLRPAEQRGHVGHGVERFARRAPPGDRAGSQGGHPASRAAGADEPRSSTLSPARRGHSP